MQHPSINLPHNALELDAHDVERLLTEETPDVRIDVLKKIAESHNKKKYSQNELQLAEQVFRLLVKDTEISVRETLAMMLKDNPNIPRDIIIALARDADSVALPIIEYSTLLTDNDLIALIHSAKHANKLSAIARRKHVSEPISIALVETRNSTIISQLLKNLGALIPESLYQNIIRDHSKIKDVMDAVAERPGLPVTIVEKVISLVSDTLADRLRNHYNISATAIAHEAEKTREVATLKLIDGQHTHEVEKLVDQLQAFGRLTPSIILTSLCRGNLYFFETSLARLSNIPVRNAQLLIHDKGGLGFKALYGKAALPDKFFGACKLLLSIVADMQRTGQKIDSNLLVQNLISQSSGKNIDNLSYIIALIRQTA